MQPAESNRKWFPCILFTPMRSKIPSLGAGRSAGMTSSGPCFKGEGCFGAGRAWKKRQAQKTGVSVSPRVKGAGGVGKAQCSAHGGFTQSYSTCSPWWAKGMKPALSKLGFFCVRLAVPAICNKHFLCRVYCDLSWQIPSLSINTRKETLSDSQQGKKSCCSELTLIQMKQLCKSINAAFGL